MSRGERPRPGLIVPPGGLVVPEHLKKPAPPKESSVPWVPIEWEKVLRGRGLRRVRRISGAAPRVGPPPEPGAKAKARRARQIARGILKPSEVPCSPSD